MSPITHRDIFFYTTLFGVLACLFSCEQEDGFIANDPTINLVFYNTDSLEQVDELLTTLLSELERVDDSLDFYSSIASDLTDTINALTILFTDSGDSTWYEIRETEQTSKDSILSIYGLFEEEDSILSVDYSKYTEAKSSIEDGEVALSAITNLDNDNVEPVIYDENDSLTVWPLPLDMNNDVTNLSIEIAGEIYEVSLEYSRINVVDEFGYILVQTFGFSEDKITHTFDDVSLDCKTSDCIDFESTIYFSF